MRKSGETKRARAHKATSLPLVFADFDDRTDLRHYSFSSSFYVLVASSLFLCVCRECEIGGDPFFEMMVK